MSEPNGDEMPPPFARELFLEWRSPRYGNSNPTDLSNSVWEWLIHTRKNAYRATKQFDGPDSSENGAVWCFERFGQSTTTLNDGRKLYIAGEHEDYYDDDFYIYNDVVLENPNGDISIFGYPKESFPPTDFHSATLLGDHVVIIGNLGYPADRKPNETQILRLDLKNFELKKIGGSGDAPGWIHSHSAALSEDGQKLLLTGGLIDRGDEKDLWENIDEWELDLTYWVWTRITNRDWQRWVFVKKDRKPSRLWRLRQLLGIVKLIGEMNSKMTYRRSLLRWDVNPISTCYRCYIE